MYFLFTFTNPIPLVKCLPDYLFLIYMSENAKFYQICILVAKVTRDSGVTNGYENNFSKITGKSLVESWGTTFLFD